MTLIKTETRFSRALLHLPECCSVRRSFFPSVWSVSSGGFMSLTAHLVLIHYIFFGLVQTADRSVLLCSDLCADEQLYNMEVRRLSKFDTSFHYPNTWAVKSWCWTSPRYTDSTEQTDEHRYVLCCSNGDFTAQWEVCVVHRAVTGGSVLSLGHLMMRGGVQIFKCPLGHLWGSVAV